MKYVEQNHKDLRLYLLASKAPKSAFTIISNSNFSEGGFSVEFGILAESHYVTVQHENDHFTEICACVDLPIPGQDPLFLTKIGDASKKSSSTLLDHTLNYCITNMVMGEVELTALQNIRAHPHSHYLEHVFPSAEPGDTEPRTEVYVTVSDSILVESVHTYPNNDAMVFTTSRIAVK